MSVGHSTRIHEVDFCAEVAKAAKGIFASQRSSNFADARIEGFGSGKSRRQRKDLRFLDQDGRVVLTGEVKLPGTPEGRSPYDAKLIRDAQQKADDANVQYFFTWNVNSFVLWDRYKQFVPLLERRVREWPSQRYFHNPDEVGRRENLDYIARELLPGLLSEVGDICAGRVANWGMPPDDIFIRSLESHLAWPTDLTRAYIQAEAEVSTPFDTQLQEWMAAQNWYVVRRSPEQWGEALDRAARTLVYVLANRVIFYHALRARFPTLPELRLRGKTPAETYSTMRRTFSYAVQLTGDYEPLFYPNDADAWAGELVFAHSQAPEAWRGTLRGLAGYDFSHISSDLVGRIFQRLIGPEERHRWGQHFTGDDIVDFINAFCVRRADATILDPACGSGSFLVRAYYRKQSLDRNRQHVELLSELYGSDIAAYPAHLATLNLAAREINDERNYPRIARTDFFDVTPGNPFCKLPDDTGNGTLEIALPRLDAVVGNPPYDLTKSVKPGGVFWPMAHHYRHVIPSNPEALVCNHRMFDVIVSQSINDRVVAAILNSTLVALWKTFYGRYTGTEGSLDTEVIDTRMIEVPDPRRSSPDLNRRILAAFDQITSRAIGRLVEEELMNCHSPEQAEAIASGPLVLSDELRQDDRRALDDAVFELLGVNEAERRRALVTKLHEETARHFRKIRVVEIQKQLQRAKTGTRRVTADELADDAWHAVQLSDWRPLLEWVENEPGSKTSVTIPEGGVPSLMPASDMYDRAVVYFGRGQRSTRVSCQSRPQAELAHKVASLGVRGVLRLPTGEQDCRDTLARLDARLAEARSEFEALAQNRSGDQRTRDQMAELMMHWFVQGRGGANRKAQPGQGRRARRATAAP